MNVTAVFDIGKTNKKFFLFDEKFQEIHREYASFDLIEDEDGHPTEDLAALTSWVKQTFDIAFKNPSFEIKSLNFSTYGASFVHLDDAGKPLTPLYNYTKPLPAEISEEFYEKYGPEKEFTDATGSTNSGMLNSGMQLYWLKKTKPEIYSKIRYSLHLPQYLSYLFTQVPATEYTSIGCHTSLWNYTAKNYHTWVYEEEIDKIFPPISETTTSFEIICNEKKIKVGIGIHDSSAALLSYLKNTPEQFVLLSTGTWNVTLNPFSSNPLKRADEQNETILYMQVDGSPVKSTRIFLGNEYNYQIKLLSNHYNVPADFHESIRFDLDLFRQIEKSSVRSFRWESIADDFKISKTFYPHLSFEKAYLQLVFELTEVQVQNLKNAIGNEPIQNLYIDGGFVDNEVFVNLLQHKLPTIKIHLTASTLGSALGAALCISDYK